LPYISASPVKCRPRAPFPIQILFVRHHGRLHLPLTTFGPTPSLPRLPPCSRHSHSPPPPSATMSTVSRPTPLTFLFGWQSSSVNLQHAMSSPVPWETSSPSVQISAITRVHTASSSTLEAMYTAMRLADYQNWQRHGQLATRPQPS